ncbi:hypothetical protein C1645_826525 [Glomus cerebriforme]|uniref:Uncharacterized protein n=1 Tax=Glomus cerebriforme TaxID=658196 RepID=A0A397SQP1_9GLOM|nr:hypothetical protein C1645_826525 [Glomus cerebriforme]
MSSQQNKICKGCYVFQNYEEFLNEKGVALKKYLDITETVYNSLISLENVNKFYEEENEELHLIFNIELSSFYDAILEDNESNKENNEHEIGHHIIKDFKKEWKQHEKKTAQINGKYLTDLTK